MIKEVQFYNEYGNGDIFLSREFVKDIMNIIPTEKYGYAHGKNPRILADIKNLSYIPFTEKHLRRSLTRVEDGIVYINCWLGATNDGRFVTRANSCSVLNSFNMFNLILTTLGYQQLSKSLEEYLPSIDYKVFDTSPVDNFIKGIDKPIVIIANCNAQSGQADNFDMTLVIQRLCDTYKDVVFVITDPIIVKASNYITTGEITKSKDGFDLNEISYLSKFSNLFIGRSSGAQIFTMTKENCMDANKAFLSFTYRIESAHIVWEAPIIRAKIFWSNAINVDDVYDIICKVIER